MKYKFLQEPKWYFFKNQMLLEQEETCKEQSIVRQNLTRKGTFVYLQKEQFYQAFYKLQS